MYSALRTPYALSFPRYSQKKWKQCCYFLCLYMILFKEEPHPYHYEYGVHDDYHGTNFNAGETADGTGRVEGSYSVLLPDGRTQHVK